MSPKAPRPSERCARPRWALTRRALLAAPALSLLAPAARAAALHPLSRILVEVRPPSEPPAFSFQTATGESRTLADYRGRGVVLNIWATWCVPCVAEMPALDRLSALLAKSSISVLAVSMDVKGLPAVKAFYAAHHIEHLPILLDPEGKIAAAFKVAGIPASFLFDRAGRLVGKSLGAAAWDAPRAVATVRRLTAPEQASPNG
ncbi:MAG: TlpA disulfide reductase family protein [Acetobacteraceae bacterium]